jgi:hypothetical protein
MSKQIVVGIFPDEAAADAAAHALKEWDYVDDDVKVNAIGVLVHRHSRPLIGPSGRAQSQIRDPARPDEPMRLFAPSSIRRGRSGRGS